MIEKLNILGAITAIIFLILVIFVFVFRLADKPAVSYWIGIILIALSLPMIYLLIKAPQNERPVLYYIQISVMLIWLAVELLLDYILKMNFRIIRWMVISYVTLFFAATGGLIGIASYAGRGWGIASIILFIIMAIFTFLSRFVTGI